MFKSLLLFFTCFLYIQSVISQRPFIEGKHQKVTVVVDKYKSIATSQSDLYNGAEHVFYNYKMIGTAYFITDDWQMGMVTYHGVLYKNVPMKYDLVRDKLVILHHNEFNKIELVSERVDSFFIGGHSFIRLNSYRIKEKHQIGFFDVLVNGSLIVFAKREKTIHEFIEGMEVMRRIKEDTKFHVVIGESLHSISNRSDLLQIMGKHRKAVQQYLRGQNIKFRKNKEAAIVAAIRFYNRMN